MGLLNIQRNFTDLLLHNNTSTRDYVATAFQKVIKKLTKEWCDQWKIRRSNARESQNEREGHSETKAPNWKKKIMLNELRCNYTVWIQFSLLAKRTSYDVNNVA